MLGELVKLPLMIWYQFPDRKPPQQIRSDQEDIYTLLYWLPVEST